ncbi:hypothetical protein RQP46_007521 [Phenoliferia psychrophenolica]
MSQTLEELVHLHALNFPLSAPGITQLSSLQLALVEFHFDTDDELTTAARLEFRRRRAHALAHPESVGALPPRPLPRAYAGLVECLRAMGRKGQSHPLRSQVGSEVKKYDDMVYDRQGGPTGWKQLASEAESQGIVVLSTVHAPSREWIALSPEYAEPVPGAPPTLTFSKDFHLASLTSPIDLATLSTYSSAELLTLQFREKVPVEVHDKVEALWWKRRSMGLDRGLEWPLDESTVPWKGFPDAPTAVPSLAFRIRGDLASSLPSTSAPSSPRAAPPPGAPKPMGPIPSPQTALPSSVITSLRTISITKLPLAVDAGPALAALLPESLVPFASVLYAPSPATNTTRQAHIAYLDPNQRTEAITALNALEPIEGGVKIRADVQDGKQPKWEWGDVRVDARAQLWKDLAEHQEQLWTDLITDRADVEMSSSTTSKRPIEESQEVALDAEGADAKRRRLERFGVELDKAGRVQSTVDQPSAHVKLEEPDTKPIVPPRSLSPPLPPYPTSTAAYSNYVSSASRPAAALNNSVASANGGPSTSASASTSASTSASAPASQQTDVSIATAIGSDPVPTSILTPLYFLGVEFTNLPSDMRGTRVQTDLFSVRFHAVGYVTYLARAPFRFYIAFEKPDGKEGVEHWVDDAKRYWKARIPFLLPANNGLKIFGAATKLPDRAWVWDDFTPEFRERHGNLSGADVPAMKPMWKAPPAKLDAWGRPIQPLAPGHFAWEQFFADNPSGTAAPPRFRAPASPPPRHALSSSSGPPPSRGYAPRSPIYRSPERGPPPAPRYPAPSYNDPRDLRDPRDSYRDPRDLPPPPRDYRDDYRMDDRRGDPRDDRRERDYYRDLPPIKRESYDDRPPYDPRDDRPPSSHFINPTLRTMDRLSSRGRLIPTAQCRGEIRVHRPGRM